MSMLYMDGFSHYQTSDILRKWNAMSTGQVTWTIAAGEGRIGSAIKRQSNGNSFPSGYLTKAPTVRQNGPWTLQQSGICGFALKVQDLTRVSPGSHGSGVQTDTETLLTVSNGGWSMFTININNDGTLQLNRAAGGGLVATSIGALISGAWSYIEVKWTISATAGSVIIHANNIEVMNYSGPVFPGNHPGFQPPTEQWTSVNWLGVQSGTPPYLLMWACDFYLLDFVGSFNNDFMNDVYVKYIVPDANGSTVLWTPNAGVNFSNVNEVPPNDDTSYNTANAPGTVDLYSFQPIGVNPLAIQHSILSRRVVPGTAAVQSIARPGVTNFLSPSQSVPNDTYAYNVFPYDTSPATGIRFTQAEVDGGLFGVNKAT